MPLRLLIVKLIMNAFRFSEATGVNSARASAVAACLLLLLNGCGHQTDSPEVIRERARILLDRDQTEESIPLFADAIKSMPDDPEAHYLRGLAYERLDVLEKALADYNDCLRLDPDRTDAMNNKAVVLAKLKRFDEAAAEFTRLVNLDPQDPLAYRNRGLCHFDLEHYDAALLDYDKAIQLAPKEAAGWFQRGNVFLEQENYARAVEDYTRAIDLDENLARAWMNRGVARYHIGEKKLAAEDLQKAQGLDDLIVLPGLDFFAESQPMDASAASPESWTALLTLARQDLAARNVSDVTVVREYPPFQCAELSGIVAGKRQAILVTCRSGNESGVTVPWLVRAGVGSETDNACSLLVLDTAAGAEHARVQQFVAEWQPDSATGQPLLMRFDLPHAGVPERDSAVPAPGTPP